MVEKAEIMDKDEIIPIFDQEKNKIGEVSRKIMRDQNLLHRSINIFLYNSK
jgi:hypothetical protein